LRGLLRLLRRSFARHRDFELMRLLLRSFGQCGDLSFDGGPTLLFLVMEDDAGPQQLSDRSNWVHHALHRLSPLLG
jgi:hypothetical protein